MTSISTTQKNHLNKMNKSAKDVSLGTMLTDLIASGSSVTGTLAVSVSTMEEASHFLTTGSFAVTAAQHSASSILLSTGTTGIRGFTVQVIRSGSCLSNLYTPKVLVTGGSNLTITSASPSWVITEDDVINWTVFNY